MTMVAVRNILSSLNSLAHSGVLAGGWLRPADRGGAVAPPEAIGASPELAEGAYLEGGVEPPLEEVLDDPLVHLMMRADHLEPEQMRRLFTPGR